MQKPLIYQLRDYLAWLKDHALPQFRDAASDMYDLEEDYQTAEESLEYYALEMKKAVERGHSEVFDRFKAKYTKLFDHVNESIARNLYEQEVNKFLHKGHNQIDAEKHALEILWQEPNFRYYLRAYAVLKDDNGREVFLVANERHIPQDNLYVLTSELESLKNSGLDPWEYVSNRRANEELVS
jgi:hypothetical protein